MKIFMYEWYPISEKIKLPSWWSSFKSIEIDRDEFYDRISELYEMKLYVAIHKDDGCTTIYIDEKRFSVR